MEDSKLTVYSYGIDKFTLCYNIEKGEIEKNLLIMHYGNGKKYVFNKDKAYELIVAIHGDKNPNGSKFDRENFHFEERHLKGVVQVLNSRLAGRAFAMITTLRNGIEYINKVQNEVVGITGYDFDGHLNAQSTNELFKDGFANFDTDNYCEPEKDFEIDMKLVS